MKLNNLMHKPDLPGMLLFQPAALRVMPNSVEVSDTLSVTGSGVGSGSNSIKTAMGEYFERRHFYREVLSRRRGFLKEFLTREEVSGFANAFAQTSSRKSSAKEIENHEFYVSEVVRGRDFSTCFIPTVCISLSSHGLECDSRLYPLRDTCGCSFHWNKDVAFLSAVKEYLERQFLLRFWLTKQCRTIISCDQVDAFLARKKSRHLYRVLAASGDVSVFDISDLMFPGACVLVVYGKDKSSRHVKYCAGMSYASTVSGAIEKALLELWQTYRFMDLFRSLDSDERDIDDSYLRYFFSCNSYDTYRDVVDVTVVDDRREIVPSSEFTLKGFLSVLSALKVFGYFYSAESMVNGECCAFCKYISPDLFLHMNNSKCINIENKYSSVFSKAIVPSRAAKMVPFP